ncbi:3-deoxy-D-manno-octulosonic acid transferase [Chitinophaga caseinilytica]|uniref:3-deoxy-D-manno-octulosonic acid transferase n=1 Tax=Chitinophaga caseinilytica TaxID=2267521 RepID=UPI003C2EE1FF
MGVSIFLYNMGIRMYRAVVGLAARAGKAKAKAWIEGRERLWPELEAAMASPKPAIWVHAASLGEFEQGRPILEALRTEYPDHRIVLTFFSPSGYEVRKNWPGADFICYLPLDTPANAARFLGQVRPQLAIFIKYEFWFHFLQALYVRQVPVLLISGIFRHKQLFFKPYGGMFRDLLRNMDHLFVQNETSITLLHNIGIRQVTLAGDTRFDRVWALRQKPVRLPAIEAALRVEKVLVAGSTWEADEEALAKWWYGGGKEGRQLVLAPHEIHAAHLDKIQSLFPDAVRFSELNGRQPDVLVIDNVGMLSALYRYGRIAYVGGGFGKAGIHNLLEPATYGRPVIIGPVFHQFHEAMMLVQLRGAIVVKDADELSKAITALNDPFYYGQSAEIAARFVEDHKGATGKIMGYIQEKRFLTSE